MIFVDENTSICGKRIKRTKGFPVRYKRRWGGSCEIFVSPAVEKTELGEKPLCRIETDSFHNTWLPSSNTNRHDVSRTVFRPTFGTNCDVFPSFGVCCVPVDPLVTSKSSVSQHFPSSFVSNNLMRLRAVSQTVFLMRPCAIQ